MQKILFTTFLGIGILSTPSLLQGSRDSSFFSSMNQPKHVEFNNCLLARVNGKPITLYDVVKKLDLIFFRQFPEYKDVLEAKYQFYLINWKAILKDLIEKELVLADAEENNFKVSSGDVRQEMEKLFGPNIIANLDELGLSYDEAWNILKGDLTIRRMMIGRIQSKTIQAITPQAVKTAYEKYAVENRHPETWKYHVISFRDKDPTKAAEAANLAHFLLTHDKVTLNNLSQELTQRSVEKETNINISEEFKHTPKEVSEQYRDILSTLDSGKISHPVAQKSKTAKGTVFRIFIVTAKEPEGADPLEKVENTIKDKIFNEVSAKETEAYFLRLRKHFAVQEYVAGENYQPFFLR